MDTEIKPDETIDCRGLSCPMPLLKTKKAIKKMKKGQIIEVIGTDPGTRNDLPDFAERSGHAYLGEKEEGSFSRFYLMVR
jgi:tRNA 2-thiouridine synthesizing protein A